MLFVFLGCCVVHWTSYWATCLQRKHCQNVPNEEKYRDKGEDGSDDLQEIGESSIENKAVAQAQIIYQLYFIDLTMDFWHLNLQL